MASVPDMDNDVEAGWDELHAATTAGSYGATKDSFWGNDLWLGPDRGHRLDAAPRTYSRPKNADGDRCHPRLEAVAAVAYLQRRSPLVRGNLMKRDRDGRAGRAPRDERTC